MAMDSNSRPVMVDLFCGRGGWTKGFLAHGWRCVGIDLFPQPEYPAEFIQADIAHLLELPLADFYCCSSPCEQFSVHSMKCFYPNPKWPWLGIALFNRAKELLEATGKPYIMENVRAAQPFLGTSDYHFRAFHLWGNCLGKFWPWPQELQWVKKGNTCRSLPEKIYRKLRHNPEEMRRERIRWLRANGYSTNKRKAASLAAEIPEVLSSHIAQMAGAL